MGLPPERLNFCIDRVIIAWSFGNYQSLISESLLPFVLMAVTPAFLPSSLFSHLERSMKVLYDIRKLGLFLCYSVYIDMKQLDKLVFAEVLL